MRLITVEDSINKFGLNCFTKEISCIAVDYFDSPLHLDSKQVGVLADYFAQSVTFLLHWS